MDVPVLSMLEIHVMSEDVNKTDVLQITTNTQPSGGVLELFYPNMYRVKECGMI